MEGVLFEYYNKFYKIYVNVKDNFSDFDDDMESVFEENGDKEIESVEE